MFDLPCFLWVWIWSLKSQVYYWFFQVTFSKILGSGFAFILVGHSFNFFKTFFVAIGNSLFQYRIRNPILVYPKNISQNRRKFDVIILVLLDGFFFIRGRGVWKPILFEDATPTIVIVHFLFFHPEESLETNPFRSDNSSPHRTFFVLGRTIHHATPTVVIVHFLFWGEQSVIFIQRSL